MNYLRNFFISLPCFEFWIDRKAVLTLALTTLLRILFSLCSLTRKGSDAQDRFDLAMTYFSFLVYQSISLIRQK